MSEPVYRLEVTYSSEGIESWCWWHWRVYGPTRAWESNVYARGKSKFRRRALRRGRKALSRVTNGVVITTDPSELLRRIERLEHDMHIGEAP